MRGVELRMLMKGVLTEKDAQGTLEALRKERSNE